MRYITLSLLFLFISYTKSIACRCSPITKELIHEMHDYYEVIFSGTVITADSWNEYMLDQSNQKKEGSEVYMRVDSVIKGNLKIGQVIYIYQTSGGCMEIFEYDSKKLVFGRIMKKVNFIDQESDTTSILPPEPSFGLKKDGSYTISDNSDLFNFLNIKLRRYSVIDTDMCSTFKYNSKTYQEVINWLKE